MAPLVQSGVRSCTAEITCALKSRHVWVGPFTFPLPLGELDVAHVQAATEHHGARDERIEAEQLGAAHERILQDHDCKMGQAMAKEERDSFRHIQRRLALLNLSLNRPTHSWWSCWVSTSARVYMLPLLSLSLFEFSLLSLSLRTCDACQDWV